MTVEEKNSVTNKACKAFCIVCDTKECQDTLKDYE